MKVKELIEELREYDQKLEVNVEVLIKGITWRIFDIEYVTLDNKKGIRLIIDYLDKKY